MTEWQKAEGGEEWIASLSLPRDHWLVIYQNKENSEMFDGVLYDSLYEEIMRVSDFDVDRCKTKIMIAATKFWLAESARILETLDKLQEAIIKSSSRSESEG